MIVYNWYISRLDCLPQSEYGPDYVIVAHWQCNGSEDNYSGSVYSTASFQPSGGSFTPYADLTKDQILGWIWVSGVDKAATEATVAQQIESKKNPPIVYPPLPWVQ